MIKLSKYNQRSLYGGLIAAIITGTGVFFSWEIFQVTKQKN